MIVDKKIMHFKSARMLSGLLRKEAIRRTSNVSQRVTIYSLSVQESTYIPVSQHGRFSHTKDCPPKCWQCDFPYKSELFCSKCKALQKFPKDLNYFDIIGVKKDFDLAIDEIQKKYRQLQALLHPDRFGQKSEKEKEISESLSSLVNKAYSTLLHPLDRGLYMLKLENVSIPEETTSLDPEFLMEIMERNEEVEEAHEDRKRALDLIKSNQTTLAQLTKKISEAFHNQDTEQAKKLLIKMKYYYSIDSRLKNLKQELGIVE